MQDTTSTQQASHQQPESSRIRYISDEDLPLSCPLPSESLWNAHPRVFLTLDEQGKAVCPYCGTTYIKDDR